MKRSRVVVLMALFGLMAAAVFAFATPAMADGHEGEPSVVDVALAINAETGEFSTLIAAASCTNLVKPLDRKPGITVFAPTDAAFADLGLNADNVCDIPRKDLSYILLYHVAQGTLLSGDVVAADEIRMGNGQTTDISVTNDGVFINDSQIIVVDVLAGNGVIHVIDAVLLP